MNDQLTLAIVVLGLLVVAGIFIWGKWQELRHKKRIEAHNPRPEADVLFTPWPAGGVPQVRGHASRGKAARDTGERREPGFLEEARDDFASEVLDEEVEEDLFSMQEEDPFPAPDVPSWEQGEGALLEIPLPHDLLFSGIDAIAALDLVEEVEGSAFMTAQAEILQQIEKPVLWAGLNEAGGVWEKARAKSSYRRWRVGLQLADRAGPVGGNDFRLFARALQRLAGDFMTVVKNLPSEQQALEQAQQLDRFCADMDIQIGINLVSTAQVFPGTKIRMLAESNGMTLGEDGFYTRRDEAGHVFFSLANAESERGFVAETLKSLETRTLTFLLDVPRTPRGGQTYRQMLGIAKGFAKTLGGRLEDDNGETLSEAQLNQIGEEFVVATQNTLEVAGLSAGGTLALRLFG
ncbi:MAG: cell division protein ZipA C-terminal FtsZ-binding domain-containing protein [Zoogloeaceae bacterium]|jgi:FtsZ-interacting cell division protein ZipA|nr:cell division protein ZipA C-terminal FtsZ-binding domain-containing protein [Zoogloeaceae bacterium]